MIEKMRFGNLPNGRETYLYTITNSRGMSAAVSNFGAVLVRLLAPVAGGVTRDVVLGFDDVSGYLDNPGFFGAVIGPHANRIGGASFSIDGAVCHLDANDGPNNLHSHRQLGYHKRLWHADCRDNSVIFTLTDEEGSMGFPGNKQFRVSYTLDEENALVIRYHASSDRHTAVNPTNHTYFNLDGHSSGSIENHELTLRASRYTPADAGSIPTGEILPVKNTPMDFTEGKKIGRDIDADFEQLKLAGGYDHNWVIDGWDGTLRQFATLRGAGGLRLEVFTTLPGVQFYTGNYIESQTGKEQTVYRRRSGLCLETQFFPDSVNRPQFPSCIFGKDDEYDSVTVYRFV